jgi:hypothetical protein
MIKVLFEIYKVLGRIGIKPKDVIGMGGDIVKMGKSLFNTRPNPKLLEYIAKNQKIPTKILENIKIHARTLKNASENQKNLFLENIKSIQKAKMPIKPSSPVTGVQRPGSSVKELPEWTKGWKPTVIKGGKDGLATGGRVGYATKGKVSLSDLESLQGLKKSEGDRTGIMGMAGAQKGPKAARDQRDSIKNKVIGTFVHAIDNLDQETSTYVKSLFNDAIQVGYETDMSGFKTEVFEKTGIIPINSETIYNAIINLDLPKDIKTEMSLFADAAGNDEIEAAMKRNDMGLTWNNDTQEIEADFTFVIGTDGNTRISPIITKDEDSEIKKELNFEHAFENGALNFSIDQNTLDNAENMEINYAGDGVSFYAQTAKDDDRNIFQTGTTIEIPFYLLNKDEKPFISAELFKDRDSDFEAKQFSGVLPIWDGLSAYGSRYEDTDGQWNETDYGLKFEKSGGLDNKFFSNIFKKDFTDKPVSFTGEFDENNQPIFDYESRNESDAYWNIGADINKDKEWNMRAGITIPFGGPIDDYSKSNDDWYEKSQIKDYVKDKQTGELVYYSEQDQLNDKIEFENQGSAIYKGSDAAEAYKAYKEKKEEFATGGIANHFRVR